MTGEQLSTKELFVALDGTTAELFALVSSADPDIINLVPFENSWTAAQLSSHVTKSNNAISQALQMEGKRSERDSRGRVEELEAIFLDFTVKFQSPAFIVPAEGIYQKGSLVEDLERSIEQLMQARIHADLSEIISLPAFGEITKFELLYFVLFHTQRHIHQLKNILHYAYKN